MTSTDYARQSIGQKDPGEIARRVAFWHLDYQLHRISRAELPTLLSVPFQGDLYRYTATTFIADFHHRFDSEGG